jgi:hypothetical protein
VIQWPTTPRHSPPSRRWLAERNRGPLPAGTFDNVLVAPRELGNATDYEVERFINEDPTVAEAGVS